MNKWHRCQLGKVINLKRGYDLPHRERRMGPFPVVSSSGITDHHVEAKVKGPGVVTGRYGTLGEVFFIEEDFWPLNTSLYVEDFKGNDPRFVSYFLRELNFESQNAAGAVPGVNRNHLHMIEVLIPSFKVQKRIANVLSAYDELIENNQRRIRILEQMARSLYREWFVHFRFPGHESHPRVASSLGEIPQGWAVLSIGDLTTKIGSGATPRGGKDSYQTHGISLIRSLNIYDYQFQMDNLAYIDDEQARQLDNVVVEPNDILLNITGASVARCAMVPEVLLPARVNQHVAIIRADTRRTNPFFLLDTLNNDYNKQRLLGIAQGGATREALTKSAISEFALVQPPVAVVKEYGKIAGAFHTQRETLRVQSYNLRRTRDLLLPRLLSGQIELEVD